MIKILYSDKFIIAVNKPCGILSESSAFEDESVLSIVSEQEKIPTLFPVHRLDRNVSGLMLLAKNKPAAGKFSALAAERELNKEYLAIVHGKPAEHSGIYKDLLFKDSASNKSYVVQKMRKGVKEASLEYRVIASAAFEDGELSLVRIRLHTGRTHQIRAQFSSRGTPLYGDGKYGSNCNRGEIALCSARMSFTHPFTQKNVDIRNLPQTDTESWKLFGEYFKDELFDNEILQ